MAEFSTLETILGAGGASMATTWAIARLYLGEKLSLLHKHEERIQALERTSVSSEKLDRTAENLKTEMRDGFERLNDTVNAAITGIHQRIDKLFERSGNGTHRS